jgi:hypothetical protein
VRAVDPAGSALAFDKVIEDNVTRRLREGRQVFRFDLR